MTESSLVRSPSNYNHAAPPASTFSDRGGVVRVQVGSAIDAQALQQNAAAQRQVDEAAPKWGSNARINGGLVRTTISEGHAVESSIPDIVSGTTGGSEAATGKYGVVASARSINGRQLSGGEVTRASLVTVDGITTTVAAAAAMGLIRQDGHTGLWVDRDSKGPANVPLTPQEARAEQLAKDQAELQALVDAREQEQDKAEMTEVPVPEAFDEATEALLTETIAGLGNQSAQAAVHAVINTGELSEGLTASLAGQLGVEGSQVGERAQALMTAFRAQADAAVGHAGGAEELWQWARENRASELKQAMVTHANQGTTGQYANIASAYFESLADTKNGRALILASKDANTWGITEDKLTGKIFINHPKAGPVEWRVAVKTKLISPNRNRR